jgi:hypothetical protein
MRLFKALGDARRGRDLPSRPAILEEPDDRDECKRRERFLTDRHILPIWYPNSDGTHRAVEALLTHLAEAKAVERAHH